MLASVLVLGRQAWTLFIYVVLSFLFIMASEPRQHGSWDNQQRTRMTAYGMSKESYLRPMSKGRASRRAKSHQTMTHANSRAVDRKSTMFQADLKYARKDPCKEECP